MMIGTGDIISTSYRLGALRARSTFSSGRGRIISLVVGGSLLAFIVISPVSAFLQQHGVRMGGILDDGFFALFAYWVICTSLASRTLRLNRTTVCILLLSAIGLLSSLVNDDNVVLMVLGGILLVKPLLVTQFYEMVPYGPQSARRLLSGLCFAIEAITVAAVVYSIVFEILLGTNPVPANLANGEIMAARLGFAPARAFFVHPGVYGSFMVISVVYSWSRILFSGSRRGLNLLLFVISCIGLLMSQRMKPLLMLPFLLATLYVIRRRWSSCSLSSAMVIRVIIIAGIVLTSLLLSVLIFEPWISFYFNNESAVRTRLLEVALHLCVSHLGLGVGLGRFGSPMSVEYHYSELYFQYGLAYVYGATPDRPIYLLDQWWAWYLGETGIWGALAFSCAIFVLLRQLYLAGREAFVSGEYRFVVLAMTALCGLLYAFGTGFADDNFSTPPTGYMIMGLVGISLGSYRVLQMVWLKRGKICKADQGCAMVDHPQVRGNE